MGRDVYESVAKGVKIRTYGSGKKSYLILFSFRGVPCKETLKGIPVTKTNNRYAKNLKAEIDRRIGLDTFKYTDYFPDSQKARVFGHAISTVTVGELLESWLKDIERSHPHSTHRAYKKSVNGVLIPALGKLRAVDLASNPEPIKDMIRLRNVTLKTIRNDLTPLRAVFDMAVDNNQVERNPLDKIKVSKLVSRENKSAYQVDPYSQHEIEQLLTACDKHRPKWTPYWQFIFYSGVRPSEGYALKWSKCTPTTALIDLAVVERQEKEVKTSSSERLLDLLPMAQDALTKQKIFTSWSEHVFINPRTNKPITDYEETTAILKYLCRKAGVRFRVQMQTRHSFASNLLSGGENPYRVAVMLGHKNVEMVFKIYGKWIEQGKEKVTEYVSDFAKNRPCTAREKIKVS